MLKLGSGILERLLGAENLPARGPAGRLTTAS
jgi:hypothetical protein